MKKISNHEKRTSNHKNMIPNNLKGIAIGVVLAVTFFVLISAKTPSTGVVKKYEALSSETMNEMNTEVNSYIKKGWQPLGGISMAYNKYGSPRFSQAMVK